MTATIPHLLGECGADCVACVEDDEIAAVEDDDDRPACPLCGSRRGVQVLGRGTVWCLNCDEPATS
jgi:hypothetical protein